MVVRLPSLIWLAENVTQTRAHAGGGVTAGNFTAGAGSVTQGDSWLNKIQAQHGAPGGPSDVEDAPVDDDEWED